MTNVFAGTAKSALDVLAGVTSEYLLNVGRTITFLSDRFAHKMTPEVISHLSLTVVYLCSRIR